MPEGQGQAEKEEQNLLWEAQKTARELAEQILGLLREQPPEQPTAKDEPVSYSKIQQMIQYEKETIIDLVEIRTEVRKLGK